MTAMTSEKPHEQLAINIEPLSRPSEDTDPIEVLAARFPVGSTVRNTDSGTLGQVAVNSPAYVIKNADAITYDVYHRGDGLVYVRWPFGGYWTMASDLELADDA